MQCIERVLHDSFFQWKCLSFLTQLVCIIVKLFMSRQDENILIQKLGSNQRIDKEEVSA